MVKITQLYGNILDSLILKGTFTASGTVVLPAFSMGGTITASGQIISWTSQFSTIYGALTGGSSHTPAFTVDFSSLADAGEDCAIRVKTDRALDSSGIWFSCAGATEQRSAAWTFGVNAGLGEISLAFSDVADQGVDGGDLMPSTNALFTLSENMIATRWRTAGWGYGGEPPSSIRFAIIPPAYSGVAATNTYAFEVAPAGITIPTGTTTLVASAAFFEPILTATGTATTACTVYIANAPTEGGTNNYALYVASGVSSFGGILVAQAALHAWQGTTYVSSVDSVAVTDQVLIGGYDISAGHRALAISSEEVVVAETDETKFSHKLPVRINGATYNIMLCAT